MLTPSLDEASHPTCILPLTSFIRGNHPDYFVCEGAFFQKGLFVVLNESGRTNTVKAICRFGLNFTLRGFEDYAESLNKVPIYCMVISACPHQWLSVAHHLASLFLSPFLGSMLNFLGGGGMEDTSEKDDLTDISAMSLRTLISPSEVGVASDKEYLEVEGN